MAPTTPSSMDIKTLHRICTFVPFEHRGDPSQQSVRDLILMALSLSTKPVLAPDEIREDIRILTDGISLHQPEIAAGLSKLVADGDVTRHPVIAQESVYSVPEDTKQAARSRLKDQDDCLQAVVSKLRARFESSPNPAIQADANRLTDDTLQFVQHLIREHGVLTARALYYGDSTEKFADASSPFLDSDLDEVARREVRREAAEILRGADSHDRAYVLGLLHAAVTYTTLHLDPSGSKLLVRETKLKQLTVLLDTNVIFRLLGLNGQSLQQGVLDTLEATKRIGCRVVVSDETLIEYKATLDSQMRSVQAERLPSSSSMIKVLADTLEEFDFRSAFLRERLRVGAHYGPETFRESHRAINSSVKRHGIQIVERSIAASVPKDDSELLNLHSRYNSWLTASEKDKPTHAVDHDVRHLLFVRRARPAHCETLDESKYLFLTCDRYLARFSAAEARRNGELPSCVLLETWMQYVAPLLPRNRDYESGFLNFLSVPLAAKSPIPYDMALEIVARIDVNEQAFSEEAVSEILHGTRARQYADQLKGIRATERKGVIDAVYRQESERVETKYQARIAALEADLTRGQEGLSKANDLAEQVRKDLEAKLKAASGETESLRTQLGSLDTTVREMARRDEEKARAQSELEERNRRLEEQNQLLDQVRAEERSIAEQALADSIALERATAERRAGLYRWGLVALAAAIGALTALFLEQSMTTVFTTAALPPLWHTLFIQRPKDRTTTQRTVIATIATVLSAATILVPVHFNDELTLSAGALSFIQIAAPMTFWAIGYAFASRKQ